MKKIAIIGCGQLGSRHLQSLARLEQPIDIFLVDPSKEALNIALGRFNEVKSGTSTNFDIKLLTKISQLPNQTDLIIVACNSFQRRQVIEEIYTYSYCKYLILEKFLFPCIEDYGIISNLLVRQNVSAWVNCARRMYSDYQNLKQSLQGIQEINMQVSSGQLGLGSNAIHYIDLFSFLGASSIKSIQTDGLKPKIYSSKRDGYIEFYGTLKVIADNGILTITSFENSNLPLTLSIATPDKKVYIQEASGQFMMAFEKENNWEQKQFSFKVQYQSELTHIAVNEIFSNNTCPLPLFEESSILHKLVLENYLNFYNSITGKSEKICPIT